MKHDFARIIKQKSGVAIMSVMLFFMVMMIMIGGLTISSQSNAKVAGESADYTAAFYAAEAGITHVTNDFRNLMNVNRLSLNEFRTRMFGIIDHYKKNPIIQIGQINNGDVFSDISFEQIIDEQFDQTLSFYIVSKGHFSGQTRILSTLVDLAYGDNNQGQSHAFAIEHAILVENSITTFNNSRIQNLPNVMSAPRIGTLSRGNNPRPISINGHFINGVLDLLPNVDSRLITTDNNIRIDRFNQSHISLPLINFEPIREIALRHERSSSINRNFNNTTHLMNHISGSAASSSYLIEHLNFSSFSGQTINVSRNIFIVTSQLTLGNVRFSGDHTLTIFVKPSNNNFNIPSLNNLTFGRVDHPNRLVVYVDAIQRDTVDERIKNQNSVTVNNGSNIIGSFMFDNTSFIFRQGSTFNGYLLTSAENQPSTQAAVLLQNNADLTISGGKAFIFARNGTVNMINRSRINGAIIARDVILNQNAHVIYDPSLLTNFPFNVSSPLVTPNTTGDIRVIEFNIHRTTER